VTAADQFQNRLEKLASDTAEAARRIANRRNITKADRATRLAALLNRANAEATALADSFTSRQLEELTGKPVPAKGIPATDDSDRLLKAARTVLIGPDSPLERVERLARSEPLASAQSAVTEAVTGQKVRGGYLGWTRQLDADACERCRWWARNGRVWPQDHRMPKHPNCACIQQFVMQKTRPRPVRKRK
jgi:hypothetical protein